MEKYYFQMGDGEKSRCSLANFLTSFLWRDGRKQNPEISYSTLVGHEFSTKRCFLEVSLVLAYFYLKKMKNKLTIADLNDFSISLDFVDPVFMKFASFSKQH